MKHILTLAGIFLTFVQYSQGRRGGDKFILGNQGPGCGPKFIFKSGSRKHKEWFILNECRDTNKHHDHHDHHYDHHHHGHHEPHVLNFPIHLPPPQHHIHQTPPMFLPPNYLPLPPAHFFASNPHHSSNSGHPSSFPYDSPRGEKGSGMLHKSPAGSQYPSGYAKYPRAALSDAYSYEAFKNEQQTSGNFANDGELDNDFDNVDADNGLAAAPAEEGTVLPSPATLRQINDWNAYQNSQLMAMRPRRNFRYGMPSPNSWRKMQNKRFANFHDKHF